MLDTAFRLWTGVSASAVPFLLLLDSSCCCCGSCCWFLMVSTCCWIFFLAVTFPGLWWAEFHPEKEMGAHWRTSGFQCSSGYNAGFSEIIFRPLGFINYWKNLINSYFSNLFYVIIFLIFFIFLFYFFISVFLNKFNELFFLFIYFLCFIKY